ncbi:unnamed protein product [Paramecium primaurelia]|uniref:PH domain-containing protein n=2 Tax=Paramecium TaxID=5884 RepID=A0A8S1K7N8_PARPR|nr:unnamed protein product [Paramecium primaurelia]CAD8049805.1 unnamed protein product [Paramecium primaurelia]CAD8136790.1 unnamed protein product [Paramecium pentaurelia]CAD8148643.1 unnamed protein product [Paramecium pentaurelia]
MQNNMLEDLKNIMKEGWLEKESRVFKSWRKRWFVLTTTTLYTFKAEKQYSNPTELIPLSTISTIKSCQEETNKENTFKIDTPETTFFLMSNNNQEKEAWIGAIGKAMVKLHMKKNQKDDDFD